MDMLVLQKRKFLPNLLHALDELNDFLAESYNKPRRFRRPLVQIRAAKGWQNEINHAFNPLFPLLFSTSLVGAFI